MWRGIFAALDAVKVGARRRIGDGEDTLVWQDPWLPDVDNGWVSMGDFTGLWNTKVSSLMITGERIWDAELLDDLFDARTSNLIKCVPLSTHVGGDSWFWLLDDKGELTVRSCYMRLQGECVATQSQLWRKIWSMKLPSKVTNLL